MRKKGGRILSLEEQEKDYIRWVLREANSNQTLAAQMLGIGRVSLWRKLKRYGLEQSRSGGLNNGALNYGFQIQTATH